MAATDYNKPWYHGSPAELSSLRAGSWVTQFREIAKAFSHKPSRISHSDDCSMVEHNGNLPGRLYVICEQVGPEDVAYLPSTGGTHWQTQRDLQVKLVTELPIDDPPQLSEDELARLRTLMPEETTGYIGGAPD